MEKIGLRFIETFPHTKLEDWLQANQAHPDAIE